MDSINIDRSKWDEAVCTVIQGITAAKNPGQNAITALTAFSEILRRHLFEVKGPAKIKTFNDPAKYWAPDPDGIIIIESGMVYANENGLKNKALELMGLYPQFSGSAQCGIELFIRYIFRKLKILE